MKTTTHNHWSPVTIPARTPDPEPLKVLDFDLSDYEREKAAERQAALELHRNAPQKKGRP